jgi:hypothetical protein
MKKAIKLKMAVTIVVDKGKALAIYSLLEPCVRLTTPRARQIATAARTRTKHRENVSADKRGAGVQKQFCFILDVGALQRTNLNANQSLFNVF